MENEEKIKLNKQLPYLVSNIVEILQVEDEEEIENNDFKEEKEKKQVVIKTSTRNTIFLPIIGLVDSD